MLTLAIDSYKRIAILRHLELAPREDSAISLSSTCSMRVWKARSPTLRLVSPEYQTASVRSGLVQHGRNHAVRKMSGK
jgi:hypothetical protein